MIELRQSAKHNPFGSPVKSRLVWTEKNMRLDKIVGGIAWPGEKPGAVVILGREKKNIHLLAESEESDTGKLLNQCAEFKAWMFVDSFYCRLDPSGMEYLRMWNKERRARGEAPLLFKEAPFSKNEKLSYHMALLKDRLRRENKTLFLSSESALPGHLQSVPSDVSGIKESEFPAIAALGHAVAVLAMQISQPKSTIMTKRRVADTTAGY